MRLGRGIGTLVLVVVAFSACKKSEQTDGGGSDEVGALIKKAEAGDLNSCGLDHGKAMGAFGVKAFPALLKAYDSAKEDANRGCILDLADETVLNNQANAGVKELGAMLACHALSAETKSSVATTKALRVAGSVVMAGTRKDRPDAAGVPWEKLEACRDSLKKITDDQGAYVSNQLDRAKSLLASLDCKCADN